MRVRYMGTDHEVKFKGIVFKRGVEKEIPEMEVPRDFEILDDKSLAPKESKNWLQTLCKIKGIGKEAVKDLERIYDTEEKFLEALKTDQVPLRNDKVELLKKHYDLGGN